MSTYPQTPPPSATDNDAKSNVRPRMFATKYANDALLAEYFIGVSKRELERYPRSQQSVASHVARSDEGDRAA